MKAAWKARKGNAEHMVLCFFDSHNITLKVDLDEKTII